MSENTKIEWATNSWNPWIGCTKVSPGCANCYAEMSAPTRVARAKEKELWGRGRARQMTSVAYWKQPSRWNRAALETLQCVVCRSTKLNSDGFCERCEIEGFQIRQRVFPSLCDWLDDEVPIEWLADFLKLIHDTPNLDWLLLTKRPENFFLRMRAAFLNTSIGTAGFGGWLRQWAHKGNAPKNVWIGTSVEDQARANERLPELLKIPAAVRFLRMEPLLGAVDLKRIHWPDMHGKSKHENCLVDGLSERARAQYGLDVPTIDWVIVGGESGAGARPCHVEWIRDVVRQCQAAGVPCFVKQLGANACFDSGEGYLKAHPIKHPKGGDPAEWPEDLRVREFPKTPHPGPLPRAEREKDARCSHKFVDSKHCLKCGWTP